MSVAQGDMADPQGSVIYEQSPLEVIMINMFVLALPLIGLVMEAPDFDAMAKPPRRSRYALTTPVLVDIAVYGFLLGSCSIAVFASSLFGVDKGVIGVNCNSLAGPVRCDPVLRARGATFLSLSLMITYKCFDCRYADRPVWHRLRNVTWFMWIASVVVIVVVLLSLYIPQVNIGGFHHAPLTWGLGIAVAGLLMFVVLTMVWKPAIRPRVLRRPPLRDFRVPM